MGIKITVTTFFDQINYSWLDYDNVRMSWEDKKMLQTNCLDKKSKWQVSR